MCILKFSQFLIEAADSDLTEVAGDGRGIVSKAKVEKAKKIVGDANAADPNASLKFDGKTLQWIVNEKPVKSWTGISGLTFKNTPPSQWLDSLRRYTENPAEWSKDKEKGPIPPGKYTVGPIQSRSTTFDNIPEFTALINYMTGEYDNQTRDWGENTELSRLSWGNYRAAIDPSPGTNTYGRGSFYIHGGSIPGSHGCIDLTDQMNDFAKYYAVWLASTGKRAINLTVTYDQSRNTLIPFAEI